MTELVPTRPYDILEHYGYLTPIGLNLPADLSYDDYVKIGYELAERRKHVMWQIAEWILFGERVHGETYAQAVLITGLSEGTLKNYVSTAHRVAEERRRTELHFSHHQEVKALEPAEQEEWLDKAVVNGWNRAELRAHLRPVENGKVTPALPSLEGAARALSAAATNYGSDYLVKRHLLIELRAALGEEDE